MKKIIFILAMVVVLSISSFAVSAVGLNCDSGDLATTCTISASQTITEDVSCNNLIINNNAVLTVDSINKVGGAGQIDIVCSGDLTVDTGAKISSDGKGYAGGASLSDGTGPGKGFRLGGNAASGAGYGGNGGIDYEVD
ncbi:MAG: hypothetical protein U9R34_07050, partial [Nanoarchaeota archaeon]|nr:hypothetical protein [Nanoarchaeota archaeon]